MNKKTASFFCDPKKAIKNTALLALMVFVVVYAGFQILPSFSQKMQTETALEVTVFDANVTNGYIFRDEEPISLASNDKVIVTLVRDGDRVSRGQRYANAYIASDYVEIQEEIDVIDDKIAVLEKSSVETNAYVTDISKTDELIKNNLDKIYSKISDGILETVNNTENELLVQLNKRTLITNSGNSYTAELESLRRQKSSLESRISVYSDKMIAPFSGYYYGDTDGFENIFDIEKLDSLTHESFKEIINSEADNTVLNSACGKIVKDFVWYVVCESEKSAAASYQVGKKYNLVFSSFSEEELTLVLEKTIKSSSENTVLLVFRGNTAPEGFNYVRKQQVNIISGELSGLAVPKNALRIINGIKGVYVTTGDIVRFRRVEIISEDGDYYIVRKPKTSDYGQLSDEEGDQTGKNKPEYKYLSLYDSVIIGGKDLFDGKIVG